MTNLGTFVETIGKASVHLMEEPLLERYY